MKKYIKSKSEIKLHFSDLFDKISEIIYVDDIDLTDNIYGSEDIDYASYSDQELLSLTNDDLHEIDDLYTIYRIYNLDRHRLTKSQLKYLQSQYHIDPNDIESKTWKYYLEDKDIEKILRLLKEHDWVDGPVRSKDPKKNFARKHKLRITPQDYVNILHSLTVEECRIVTPYLTVSRNINNLGNNLVVFDVNKEFELEDGTKIGKFKVYVKIDLTRTNVPGEPIALISFHE